MKEKSSNKKIMLIGAGTAILLGIFFYFYSSRSQPESTLQDAGGEEFGGVINDSALTSPQSARVVRLMLELQRIDFSRDILSSETFKNLSDQSVRLSPEAPGKSNPFEDIGRGGKPSAVISTSDSATNTAPITATTTAATSTR